MRPRNFFDLVKLALPPTFASDELVKLAPENWWRENPRLASAYALRKSSRIDWRAYLARNPDVAQISMDPCLHFLKYGIFEGRKLIVRHPLAQESPPGAPSVSVIIPNYNNEIYLGKCLDSITGQTLRNIEIIVVDDGSSDDSVALLERVAAQDSRIRLILHRENQGTFLARKAGVMAARGEYVLFVDPDDYLASDTCELAFNAVINGYDMCVFGVNIIGSDDKTITDKLTHDFNDDSRPFRTYNQRALQELIFEKRLMPPGLIFKMFRRELCVAAYNDLEEGFFIVAEDIYLMLALARIVRNMVRISKHLYFYNCTAGISNTSGAQLNLSRWLNIVETTRAIKTYCEAHGLQSWGRNIEASSCAQSVDRFLDHVRMEDTTSCFALMLRHFSASQIIGTLIDRHSHEIERVANVFCHLEQPVQTRIKNIGIFYYRLSPGGAETVITLLAHQLEARGYGVTFFVEERSSLELPIPENAKVIKIASSRAGKEAMKKRCEELIAAATEERIDLFLYAYAGTPPLLWDMLALRCCDIPTIVSWHGAFSSEFLRHPTEEFETARPVIFRCAAALTCLSHACQTFLRMKGVNAWYVANPVRSPRGIRAGFNHNIAVMARLGDAIKQPGQSLLALQEVVRVVPDARMYAIGGFTSVEQRKKFFELADRYGVRDHIVFTGWLVDPMPILAECSVLLSTSYWESFGLSIAEAQGLGMPCVIYEVTTELVCGNESIIQVKQGDFKGAARALINLFEHPAEWARLSTIAKDMASRYSPEIFGEQMLDMFNHWHEYSPWSPPKREDYETIIKFSSFYALHNQPKNLG